jgi:photosystem II stability/assembly factor-like uncharacterized protein
MNQRVQGILVLAILVLSVVSIYRNKTASNCTLAGRTVREHLPERRDGREAESDWFMVQRVFPGNDIPRNAAANARGEMKNLFPTAAPVSGPDWRLAGPSNIGGRVTAILLDPVSLNVIYAAAASGGVWKSDDFGTHWTNIFNESFSIGSLAFSPDNSNVIYVGTGEANPSSVDTYPGNGIWRSTDAGATWTNLGLTQVGHIGKIVVNPHNPNTIFVAALGLYRSKTTDRGIYRSTNRGATWTNVLFVNDTTGAADIAIDPSDTNTVLTTSWTYYRTLAYVFRGGPGSALYRSTNGGTVWTKNISGVPHDDPNCGRISLAFSPSSPAIVYALAANGGGYNWGGVYRSSDHGATWTLRYAGSSGESQVWYNNIILVHPTNPNMVWAGMTTLYLSTDGGATFAPAPISGAYHVDHHDMAYSPIDPSTLVLGNDGGVYISTNDGSGWFKAPNLPITQYYAGTVSNLNPNRLLGGTQDNGSSETGNGADPWSFFWGGDGFYCLIDPTDSNYIYAETQNAGIVYSTNGGGSFFGGTNGLDFGEWNGWETPIALDPQHPKTLYTGFESVYRTKNNMQSWTKISPNLTYQISSAYSTVSTIDVSPVDSNVIYAGTGDGKVWVTTNGGSLWTDVSAGLPLRWVTRVVTDPAVSNIAYVTLSGFRQYDSSAHVYRTSDFGSSWSSIGNSLPNVPVNDLVVDPANRTHLFVATDLNVMVTNNGGAAWSVLGTALPTVTVHDLAFHSGTRELVAFTHGRSVYTIQIPDANFTGIPINLNGRWNLVSVPLHSQIDSVHYLFPMSIGPAFSYLPGGGYLPRQTMPPGSGYWLQLPGGGPQQALIYGYLIPAETLAVNAGWNLIGSVSAPAPQSSITAVGTTIVSNLFGYSNGYLPVDTIAPGGGYWVNVDQAGSLIVQSAGAAKTAAAPGVGEVLGRCSKLTVRDAAGNSQSLYLGRSARGMSENRFTMPPLPAEGLFDARFSTNSMLALDGEHVDRPVRLRFHSARYPVKIDWQSLRDIAATIHAGDLAAPMDQTGSIVVTNETDQVTIDFGPRSDRPKAFRLSQNYPNPFNPTTEISYSIPEEAHVRLTVYSTTGQEIATLVDHAEAAGERKISWNAVTNGGDPVASGVYLYRIEMKPLRSGSGSVTLSKKMVYLR